MLLCVVFSQGVTPKTGLKHWLACLTLDVRSPPLLKRCVYQNHENFECHDVLSASALRLGSPTIETRCKTVHMKREV